MNCRTTHHHACDCREAEFAKLREENARLQAVNGERRTNNVNMRAEYKRLMEERDQLRTLLASAREALEECKRAADTSYSWNVADMAITAIDAALKGSQSANAVHDSRMKGEK